MSWSKINRSPLYWLILGVIWSLAVLALVLERQNFVSDIVYLPTGLAAALCYGAAIFWAVKGRAAGKKR